MIYDDINDLLGILDERLVKVRQDDDLAGAQELKRLLHQLVGDLLEGMLEREQETKLSRR